MEFQDGDPIRAEHPALEIGNDLMSKSFFWMFLGVLGTALFSWFAYATGIAENILRGNGFTMLLLAEVVVVLVFSLGFKKLSASIVGILFFAYSMINGLTLSVIYYAYELNSIVTLFVVTAGIFGVLGLIGKNTKRDLTNFGTMLSMFLIGALIMSLINLFLHNSMMDMILDWAILAIFLGITVYDVYRLKNASILADSDVMGDKMHIYFAMQLYLDFINIFLNLLNLFGKRKN